MSSHNKQTHQSESLADLLRVAEPRLIIRITPDPYNEFKRTLVPTIREVERESEEVIDEGYDLIIAHLVAESIGASLYGEAKSFTAAPFGQAVIRSSRRGEPAALPIATPPERGWRRSKRSSRATKIIQPSLTNLSAVKGMCVVSAKQCTT
jgi:hypothetical protein